MGADGLERLGKAVLRWLIGKTFSDNITQQFEDC
jgi:hypothetical protein